MLRIVKATEPITVDRINLCLYAPPGVGKTTTFFTAESPLLLDFDKGVHRAANRKDVVQITSWADVAAITAEDLLPYRTLGIDTAGRALDFLAAAIIKENPKAAQGDGSLSLKGFGALKAKFSAWLRQMNTFGLDVVLLAHMDEQRSGDDIIERLDVQGGSKGEIYKSVDAMGRIFVRDVKQGNVVTIHRTLDFSPRERSFGKNPANLQPIPIPEVATNDHFLADVIADVKAAINAMSEEQKKAAQEAEQWCDLIRNWETADDFNRSLSNPNGIATAPVSAREFFKANAKQRGLMFNKEANRYEVPQQAAV